MPAKPEMIYVRVDAATGAAIDAARGSSSRARWVADVIESALSGEGPMPDTAESPIKGRPSRSGGCDHPRGRVIKNFCYKCGRMVPAK